jgi:hypothetical protein
MKKPQIIGAGVVFILGLALMLHAQDSTAPDSTAPDSTAPDSTAPDSIVQVTAESQGLSLVSPGDLPENGTFWLVDSNGVLSPDPCLPPEAANLPIYGLADGVFLVDGTCGQVATDPGQVAALGMSAAVSEALAAQATNIVNLINQVQAAEAGSVSRAMSRGGMMTMDDESDDDSFTPAYSFPTNGLWLQITNYDGNFAYLNLHNATDQVYAIWSTTDLTTPYTNWTVETELWPVGGQTNVMPFTIPTLGRTNLFVRAEDWTGVDSDGDGIPDWWIWMYFGNLSETATNLDANGNTLLYDYQNGFDPNVIAFTIESANDFVNTAFPNVQLAITAGNPSYYAVLVNGGATTNWLPFVSTNLTVSLGSTDGVYDVSIGLKGLPANATQTWADYSFTLDTVPPVLVITNPTTATVIKPYLQLQGFANEPLASLSYDISNALGVATNQNAFVTDQHFDTNAFDFTTNYFQAYDVPLATNANYITLRVTDRAGNMTTTNFNVTLDYTTATNPPVVGLIWPQDGWAVSGTNITIRGTMSDETGTIVAQVVNGDGTTNEISGIVERNNMFWLENVPLNGTNQITLQATDAAGNVTTTNFTVLPSSLTLTIDSTPTGDALYQSSGSVYGTVSDPSATVTVNGVVVTNDYWTDGETWYWEVDNVPIYGQGTATFDVQATTGGYPTNNASTNVEMGAYAAIVEHYCSEPGSYDDLYGEDDTWTHVKDYSASYQPNAQGQWVSTYAGSLLETDNYANSSGSGWYDNSYHWSETNRNNYYLQQTDSEGDDYYFTGTIGSGDDIWDETTGVPDEDLLYVGDPPGWVYHYYAANASYATDGGDYTVTGTVNAHTKVTLYTGGKAQIQRQSLFGVGVSATAYGPPPPDNGTSKWLGTPTTPIDPTKLTVLGKHPGADGNLWIALPDNSPGIDLTVTAPASHYNAGATPTKYHPYINLYTSTANANLDTDVPEVCVGQLVTLGADWQGTGGLGGVPPYANILQNWTLPGEYVNQPTNYSATCATYVRNDNLLTNLVQQCWYVNKPGGTVSVGMDLQFANGQTVPIAADGSFTVVKATIDHITNSCSGVNMFTNSDGSLNEISLVDTNHGFGMQIRVYVKRPDHFSGHASMAQLIKRQFNWNTPPLGIPWSDTTSGNFWLDTIDPYKPAKYLPLTENGHPTNPVRSVYLPDAPLLGEPTLGFYSSAEAQDDFHDYVQFQPDGGGSIAITIGRVDWGWHGKATTSSGVWSLVTSTNYCNSPDSSDDSFPVWPYTYTGTSGP